MDLTDLFDEYSRQARLQPALLVLLPILVSVAAWWPDIYHFSAALAGLAVTCGAALGLAHLTRSLGRKVEAELYGSWGGKPTTRWLMHGDRNLDAQTKGRYHATLSRHVPGWRPPSAADEARDTDAAASNYDSAVRWLREKTRDRARFGLVFRENVSYGFRRNLYALKPIGLPLALLAGMGNVAAVFDAMSTAGADVPLQGIASLALSLVAVAGWVWMVRRGWVRDAADAYARARLAACDAL